MKTKILICLIILCAFLISGINGCVPSEELEQKVIAELKAKYSKIDDYSMFVKETYIIEETTEINCFEILIKKPNKLKRNTNMTCERKSKEGASVIYAGNVFYAHHYHYPPEPDLQIYKKIYTYDIAKEQMGELFFEDVVKYLFEANAEISLIGKELYEPLQIKVYHVRIRIPKSKSEEEVIADIWIDKETYVMVRMESKYGSKKIMWEIQGLKINEGISDFVFEPTPGFPVLEEPEYQRAVFRQSCEYFCRTKSQREIPPGISKSGVTEFVYDYCEIFSYDFEVPDRGCGYGFVKCYEDPVNIECPEIECPEVTC